MLILLYNSTTALSVVKKAIENLNIFDLNQRTDKYIIFAQRIELWSAMDQLLSTKSAILIILYKKKELT